MSSPIQTRVWSIIGALLAMLLVTACSTRAPNYIVSAVGESPILITRETSAKQHLDWSLEQLGSESVATFDTSPDALAPGTAIATAKLQAHDQVMADLHQKITGLNTDSGTVGAIATRNSDVLSAMNNAISGAEVTYNIDMQENEVTAQTTVALDQLEQAVLLVVNGDDGPAVELTDEELMLLAEQNAQREALGNARGELYEKVRQSRAFGDEPLVQQLRRDRRAANVVERLVRRARPIESQRTANNTWRIILEVDLEPAKPYLE